MRATIAFVALALLAVPAVAAEGTITSTVNCLAYLAADTELGKAEEAYRAAKLQAHLSVQDYRRQAESAANSAHDQKVRAAKAVQEEAHATADRTYKQTMSAWKSKRDAEMERNKEYERIDRAVSKMIKQALESAKPAYLKAVERAIDAYIAVYTNPGPGLHRDVSGYDRDLILTMAESQRQLCPEAP